MTKSILDELSKSPLVTKELIQYLATRKIDSTSFMVKYTDADAYGELTIFFRENFNVSILLGINSLTIYKDTAWVKINELELTPRELLTFAIIMTIRHINNPF